MAIAIDSKVVIKVKTSGFGIDKELNGCAVRVFGISERLIERRILGAIEFSDLGSSFGSLGLGDSHARSGNFRLRRRFDARRIIRIASRINAFTSSGIGRRVFGVCRRISRLLLLRCCTTLVYPVGIGKSDCRRKRKRQSTSRNYAHRLLIEQCIGFLHVVPLDVLLFAISCDSH